MFTKIDRYGRIFIPKKVRDNLGLKPGTQLSFEKSNKKLILKPLHDESYLIDKGGVLVYTGVPIENIENSIEKHRNEHLNSFHNNIL